MAVHLSGVRHSVVYRAPSGNPLNYFGWPTVAKLDSGKLVVGASGFRAAHVCPFGMTVLWESSDDGASWSKPVILNNSAADDRDAGIVPLGGGDYLVSWFTSDVSDYIEWYDPIKPYRAVLEGWDKTAIARAIGSYVRRVNADGSFGPATAVQVSAPHGPIRLADGRLFYLGVPFGRLDAEGKVEFKQEYFGVQELLALESRDQGATWRALGKVPPVAADLQIYEPHAIELADGRILGAIRVEPGLSTWLVESADGGMTWSEPRRAVESGSPPHLFRHSSGAIVLSYGYRQEPFGQRAVVSRDEGATWGEELIIRADGLGGDLGYPSSVELADGSILTVCYQALPEDDGACSILASTWRLPEA